jgi:hypothetical protein
MASGDIKFFAQALHDLGNKIHDLDTDDWRMGIVTSVTAPTVATAAPHWGGTGTTNFLTTQVVTTGTSYTAPVILTAESWTLGATGATMDFADVSLAQDASGFTNGRWGIVFNNTDANKRCLGYVDLGSDRSLVTGSLAVTFSASGVLALAQA